MATVKLVTSYDGTCFAGSQVQKNARTVQGEFELALARLTRRETKSAFAGRTDRGVHAAGQVVSCDVPWNAGVDSLQRALNSELPRDVAVVDAEVAEDSFHARFDARWREYRYMIVEAPIRPVLDQRYAWWIRDQLDVDRVRSALRHLVGSHLFGSFAGSGLSQQVAPEKLRRTVLSIDWSDAEISWPTSGGPRRRHVMRVVATGFLPNMVRNIVATLVQVARGHRDSQWVQSVVGANDRRSLECAPAPPEGLILWQVGYSDYDSSRAGTADSGSGSADKWCGAFE